MARINGLAYGSGIILFKRNPDCIIVSRRTMVNTQTGGSIPYPGMLDIIGGHLDVVETKEATLDEEKKGDVISPTGESELLVLDHEDPDFVKKVILEAPAKCVVRELSEEFKVRETGEGFVLSGHVLCAMIANRVSKQWVYAKEMDFSLDEIDAFRKPPSFFIETFLIFWWLHKTSFTLSG